MRPMTLHLLKADHKLRRGVASIEFLMMMPVLVTFIAVTFWVARVLIAGIHAGQVAEESVRELAASHQTISELQQLPAFDVVQSRELEQLVRGFDERLKIDSGLVKAESTQDTGEGVAGVITAVGSAADRHATLAHSWESELFAFPPSTSVQPPLTLPRAIRGIAPDMLDVTQFRELLSFKGRALGNGALLSDVARRITNSTFSIDHELPELVGQIEQLNDQISRLSRLSPGDPALAGLQAQLRKLQEQEQAVIEAQRLIGQQLANSLLFTTPEAQPEH